MTSPMESSLRPRWLNRKLRDRSRSTSCSAFHDGAASSGASNSFSIQAEYRFSVARSHALRIGQTLPGVVCGRGGSRSSTAMSRVMVLHSAGARSRARVTRHVPAAGAGTSANQKYGGPPIRSRDLAETLPLGAIRDSSPSSGFSTTKSTRKGAPFHGVTGEGRTARSAASPHGSPGPLAWTSTMEKRQTKNAPAVTAASRRAGVNWGPLRLDRNLLILRKLWLNHGTIPSPGESGGKLMMNKPCLSRRSSVPPSRHICGARAAWLAGNHDYAAILSSLLALVCVVPAAAQSSAPDAAATCGGSDADSASPEARESACLLELGDRATRKGNVCSLDRQ